MIVENYILYGSRMYETGYFGLTAEVRWLSSGNVNTNGWMLYYKGDERLHQLGVGFLVSPRVAREVVNVQDSLIVLRL